MMMKGGRLLRLTLQKQHPQTHASISQRVDDTIRKAQTERRATQLLTLQVKDHLQAGVGSAEQAEARLRRGSQPVGLHGCTRSVRCEEEASRQ